MNVKVGNVFPIFICNYAHRKRNPRSISLFRIFVFIKNSRILWFNVKTIERDRKEKQQSNIWKALTSQCFRWLELTTRDYIHTEKKIIFCSFTEYQADSHESGYILYAHRQRFNAWVSSWVCVHVVITHVCVAIEWELNVSVCLFVYILYR